MTTSHSPSLHPTSDREALSALFDGELAGDAARFALKRLDHDQEWRGTCERWSLVGDLMRAQGQALLPAGFPARVRAAAVAQAPAVAATATPTWARWGGVGLAASVAVAALFFARQSAPVESPVAPPMVATTPDATLAAPVQPARPRPDAPGAAQLASAGVAVTQVARNGTQRARRTSRVAVTTPAAPVREVATLARVPSASSAMAATPPLLQQPIDVPPFTGEAVVRPWPRAVLPQIDGSTAMAAGFGTASPSFYPFEPRLPGNEDRATDDTASQDEIAP